MANINLNEKTDQELKTLQKTWEDEISDLEDEMNEAKSILDDIYFEQNKRRQKNMN